MLPDWSLDFEMRPKPPPPLGFGPFGERPPIPANDQGSTLSRAVSDDFEAIFADAPPPAATRRATRVQSLAPQASKTAARASRITAWGGIIAAAVAGVVIGTLIVKQPPKAPPPPAAVVAQAPTAAELTPAPVAKPAPPVAEAAAKPARTRPVVRRATASRSAVLAADRELRQAYAAAGRAGVPRARLVSIRNRWVGLRDDPPARLVAGYGALARDLRQQAASAKSHHRKRGLFG